MFGYPQISKAAVKAVSKDTTESIDRKKLKSLKKQIRKAKIWSVFKKEASVTDKIDWSSTVWFLSVLLFFASIIGVIVGIATQNSKLIWWSAGIFVSSFIFLYYAYLYNTCKTC